MGVKKITKTQLKKGGGVMTDAFGVDENGVLVILGGNPAVENLQGWIAVQKFSESDFSAILKGCDVVAMWRKLRLAEILGGKEPIRRLEELLREGTLKLGDFLTTREESPSLKPQTSELSSLVEMRDGENP